MEKQYACAACGATVMAEEKPATCATCGKTDTMVEVSVPQTHVEGNELD